MKKFDEDHAAAATNLLTEIEERDSDDDEQDDALQLKLLHILVKYMNILLINISSKQYFVLDCVSLDKRFNGLAPRLALQKGGLWIS